MNYKINPIIYIIIRIQYILFQIRYVISGESHYWAIRNANDSKKAIKDIFKLIVNPYHICHATYINEYAIYLGKNIYMIIICSLYTKDPIVWIDYTGSLGISAEIKENNDMGIHIVSNRIYNPKNCNISKEDLDKIISAINDNKDIILDVDHCLLPNMATDYISHKANKLFEILEKEK
jgi:hypothetical protein